MSNIQYFNTTSLLLLLSLRRYNFWHCFIFCTNKWRMHFHHTDLVWFLFVSEKFFNERRNIYNCNFKNQNNVLNISLQDSIVILRLRIICIGLVILSHKKFTMIFIFSFSIKKQIFNFFFFKYIELLINTSYFSIWNEQYTL